MVQQRRAVVAIHRHHAAAVGRHCLVGCGGDWNGLDSIGVGREGSRGDRRPLLLSSIRVPSLGKVPSVEGRRGGGGSGGVGGSKWRGREEWATTTCGASNMQPQPEWAHTSLAAA